MNRREFVKGAVAVAGITALGSSCAKETATNETSNVAAPEAPPLDQKTNGEVKMKTAVVYFSWSGNTRFAAELIGDAAKVLPPKAFGGSSIKSNVAALEAFVDERVASK